MSENNHKVVYTAGSLWETWGPAPFGRVRDWRGHWRYKVRDFVDELLGHEDILFEYDPREHEIYFRSPRERAIRGFEWRLIPELTADQDCRVLGALAFNLAYMEHGPPDWIHVPADRDGWVCRQLEHAGLVVNILDTWIEHEARPSVFLPIAFEAHSRVSNKGLARRAMRCGIGKMRRFGFGVLHFHAVNEGTGDRILCVT